MTTLLTSGPVPDPEQRRKKENAHALARDLVLGYVGAFEAGEITLEKLLRFAHGVLSAEDIDPFDRQKILGAVAERAIGVTPPSGGKGRRKRQRWLGRLAYQLVERAHQDGHGKGRAPAAGRSAFEVVAELCRRHGLEPLSTVAKVEAHRADWLNAETHKAAGDSD